MLWLQCGLTASVHQRPFKDSIDGRLVQRMLDGVRHFVADMRIAGLGIANVPDDSYTLDA